MVIPKGKKVFIHRIVDGESISIFNGINPVPVMVLNEPLTLSLSSSFEPFLQMTGNKWINELGKLAKNPSSIVGSLVSDTDLSKGFSGVLLEAGYQTWVGTDPLSVNITVTFHINKTNVDAENQVYNPTIELAKLPLPTEGIKKDVKVPMTQEKVGVTNLSPPGPSVVSILKTESDAEGQLYNIKIGKILNIFPAIIKKAEPTYSIETDDNGYPIWAQVNLDIQSVAIATQEMLTRSHNF